MKFRDRDPINILRSHPPPLLPPLLHTRENELPPHETAKRGFLPDRDRYSRTRSLLELCLTFDNDDVNKFAFTLFGSSLAINRVHSRLIFQPIDREKQSCITRLPLKISYLFAKLFAFTENLIYISNRRSQTTILIIRINSLCEH